ncbi:MAG: pyridoxamine 5'-phosphate oxidase family protein [Acidimicrobiia bacterium]|nr:pyridoxamine 5'-phosphate oxidase family protein [Acidimicrobiia bacterium]
MNDASAPTEAGSGFRQVLADPAQLRDIYRQPHERVLAKKTDRIDDVTAAFIAGSPFCLISTAGADGTCDVSPRGGPAGFCRVLDEGRIAIPDLNGNNLLDSQTNIVTNPHIGMLFLVPGRDETLRLNGRACITTDPEILALWDGELRRPVAAIGVSVTDTFIHCAKAFRRGGVWDAEAWAALEAPTGAEMLVCHSGSGEDPAAMAELLEQGYAIGLDKDRPA